MIWLDHSWRRNGPTRANRVSSNATALTTPNRCRSFDQRRAVHDNGVHHRVPVTVEISSRPLTPCGRSTDLHPSPTGPPESSLRSGSSRSRGSARSTPVDTTGQRQRCLCHTKGADS
jgi:hypothetical protein